MIWSQLLIKAELFKLKELQLTELQCFRCIVHFTHITFTVLDIFAKWNSNEKIFGFNIQAKQHESV